MDFNSIQNQKIKDKFIGIHVYSNVNEMATYILSKTEDKEAPFDLEDIQNFFSYPEYYSDHTKFEGGKYEDLQKEIDRLTVLISEFDEEKPEKMSDKTFNEICNDIDALEALEPEPQEVYEWWMVSPFLCEKLDECGYPVVSDYNIWGRCTTGQAISMDYVIGKICSDMEILEGQENEWK